MAATRSRRGGHTLGTTLRILLMALLAGASPLALTLTIAVLKTRLARVNGVIFAVAFLLGETIGWILALALGAAANIGDGDDVVAGILELALGVLLLPRPGACAAATCPSRAAGRAGRALSSPASSTSRRSRRR